MSEALQRATEAVETAMIDMRPGTTPNNRIEGIARAVLLAVRDLPPAATTHDDCNRWGWSCQTCGGPKENWQLTIDRIMA